MASPAHFAKGGRTVDKIDPLEMFLPLVVIDVHEKAAAGVTASGHETTDTDPGIATTHDDYALESYIIHKGHHQNRCAAPDFRRA